MYLSSKTQKVRVRHPSFVTCKHLDLASLMCCLPGCAEGGTPAGVLVQGLVSRAGRAGGRTGGLAAAAAEKAGDAPFTTADRRQTLVRASLCVGITVQCEINATYVVMGEMCKTANLKQQAKQSVLEVSPTGHAGVNVKIPNWGVLGHGGCVLGGYWQQTTSVFLLNPSVWF